jgi:hypothetical protein
MATRPDPEKVGLPARPFFYTLDQIAGLLSMDMQSLYRMVFYEGRTLVIKQNFHLWAVNLAAPGDKPEWRVIEEELIRWMRYKHIEVTESREFQARRNPRYKTFRQR